PDPELLGEGACVHRPGAAEGEQRKIPRVKAATGEDQPHRLRHRGFDNPLGAEDRFVPGKMQGRCEGLDPFCGEGLVEGKPTAEWTATPPPDFITKKSFRIAALNSVR